MSAWILLGSLAMEDESWEEIDAGQILVPAGMPAVAQIPIPNSGGLTLSFWTNARSHVNPSVYQDVRLALQQLGLRDAAVPGRPLSTGTIFNPVERVSLDALPVNEPAEQ